MDAQRLWDACAEVLRTQVSDAVWLMSFQTASPIGFDGERLVLGVPSSVARERIESRYLGLVEAALDDAGYPGISVDLEVRRELETVPGELDDLLARAGDLDLVDFAALEA